MTVAPPATPLRLTIDGEALAHNWQTLDALSGAAKAGAAVKADAYGLGARRVAPLLARAGCADFFVAHWAEAADLVDLIDPRRIAVLHGPLTDADVAFAKATGVRPVLNSLDQARRWREAGGGLCDVMVDTGMNRLGLAAGDLGQLAGLEVDVLHSHLASGDEDSALNALQLQRWQASRGTLPHRRAALANSAGIALGAAYHGDLTRPGLALYGGIARAELADVIRPVVQPQVALLQVRQVAAGDTIGYNATFTAPGPMRLGTVALGYADGYLRCWSGQGMLRTGDGGELPVLGRVSMDLTIVDLTHVPHLTEGDWLNVDYDLPRAAAQTGLSQYELLTGLGNRFARAG
ncbi:alanine racemase [Novosphingobium terrae]|uniref:alanine racemase n=1 Tax=Novosphingobium terrae TaxID=2726189 RepID=UPI00197F2815|nr:alanine racemase [Novosphingobium terrae]